MAEKLTCPSCSGQMDLGEFKPGDKIAKCPYCGTVVDLPDGPATKRKVTKFSEKKSSLGGTVERSVHVVEEQSVHYAEDGDPGFDDLMKQVKSVLGDQGKGGSFAKQSSQSKNLSFSATFTSKDDSPGGDMDLSDLPEEIRDKVGDMFDEMKNSSKFSGKKTKKKKSFWKRLFGK